MNDQPTPWADINPPMASARPQEPRSPSLVPATREQFAVELTACLALVAPVGMTEESRREWLSVAWRTLGHLPADLLASGCAKARQTCDHPAKLVPAIIDATKEWMRLRKDSAPYPKQQALPRPDYVKPEEAAQILEEYGLKSPMGRG